MRPSCVRRWTRKSVANAADATSPMVAVMMTSASCASASQSSTGCRRSRHTSGSRRTSGSRHASGSRCAAVARTCIASQTTRVVTIDTRVKLETQVSEKIVRAYRSAYLVSNIRGVRTNGLRRAVDSRLSRIAIARTRAYRGRTIEIRIHAGIKPGIDISKKVLSPLKGSRTCSQGWSRATRLLVNFIEV